MLNNIVATGVHSGLGREAIKHLDGSYHVISGCREPAQDSGLLSLDLSNKQSVEQFARDTMEILKNEPIHALLLCAGVIKAQGHPPDSLGEDYAVNVLGHAYLIQLLKPKFLPKTRILLVGSLLHKQIQDAVQLENILTGRGASYSPKVSYAATKCAQMCYAKALRDAGFCVTVVSPGFIPYTRLNRELGLILRLVAYYILPWLPFARSIEQGGISIANALQSDQTRSLYVGKDQEAAEPTHLIYDQQACRPHALQTQQDIDAAWDKIFLARN